MSFTRILPTSPNGQVYYGPRDFAAAVADAQERTDTSDEYQQELLRRAESMEKAGYVRAPQRLRALVRSLGQTHTTKTKG